MKKIRFIDIYELIMSKSIWRIRAQIAFGQCGKKTWMMKPLRIIGGNEVKVGNSVTILPNLRLETWKKEPAQNEPCVIIGHGTNIEQNVHITAARHIRIGNDVSICGGVTITDIIHPYEDISIPPERQMIENRDVNIGDECFIGMNSVIMPGVTLGRHCVIGANSVVTHDIPGFSVAAGVPAKIIKVYDERENKWAKEVT